MGLFVKEKNMKSLPLLLISCKWLKPNTILLCHLRSDNGREYVYDEFHSELSKHGILQQLTCPYTL